MREPGFLTNEFMWAMCKLDLIDYTSINWFKTADAGRFWSSILRTR